MGKNSKSIKSKDEGKGWGSLLKIQGDRDDAQEISRP